MASFFLPFWNKSASSSRPHRKLSGKVSGPTGNACPASTYIRSFCTISEYSILLQGTKNTSGMDDTQDAFKYRQVSNLYGMTDMDKVNRVYEC